MLCCVVTGLRQQLGHLWWLWRLWQLGQHCREQWHHRKPAAAEAAGGGVLRLGEHLTSHRAGWKALRAGSSGERCVHTGVVCCWVIYLLVAGEQEAGKLAHASKVSVDQQVVVVLSLSDHSALLLPALFVGCVWLMCPGCHARYPMRVVPPPCLGSASG